MPTVPEIHRRGTRALQPLASAVTIGTLYFVTDELVTERSNGTAWESFSGAGAGGGDVDGPASATDLHIAVFDGTTGKLIKDGGATISSLIGAGTGDVMGPASSVTGNLAVFADTTGKELADGGQALPTGALVGTTDAQTLSNKTLTTPTIPDFTNAPHTHQVSASGGTLTEAALALTDVTTNDATAARHGFAPKLSGTATQYLDGSGAWSTPAGSASGDVTGPAGANDSYLPIFNGTTGKALRSSAVYIGAAGDVNYPDNLRQTFNPGSTTPGVNVGSQAGDPTIPVDGDLWYNSTTNALRARIGGASVSLGVGPVPRVGAVGLVIDGGGSVITTGVKGFLRVPFACTITGVTLLSTDAAATAGSIVVDIWKDTYANYPPTVADTITASAKPTLSSANKSEDTTLTGWTTAIAAGDVLGFHVDSAATVTRVTLVLTVQAT